MATLERDWIPAMFATNMAIICGVIDQGAIDRGKLVDYLSRLSSDLSHAEREQPYGRWLHYATEFLQGQQPNPKPPEWIQ